MPKDNLYIQTLEQFAENIHEGILVFHIEYRNYRNHLLFSNSISREFLSEDGEADIAHLSLEELLGLSSEGVREFVREKLVGKNLQEERVIQFKGSKTGIYMVGYHVFNVETGFLLEMFIREISDEDYSEDLHSLETGLEKETFSEGFIALLVVRNHEALTKPYGYVAGDKIQEAIEVEYEKIFKTGSRVMRAGHTYVMIIQTEHMDMVGMFRSLINAVQGQLFEVGIDVPCDLKVGISTYKNNKYAALREAKFSLHELYSKQGDVGQYVAPNDQIMMDYVIRNDLPYAIKHNELSVVFQGIYNIITPGLYGLEVLIRWNHSKYGDISPAKFIPVAEKSDMVTELDLWVLKTALNEFDKLDVPNKKRIKLNFNVSPRDFFDPTFVDRFIETVEKSNVKFSNIILELTETLNLYPKKGSLQRLKDKGIMIALDDFGTGFSSLSQIKHYRIDFLKIDISFVRDINKNYDNTLITNAILALANNLDINVIAEGVESTEQIDFLKRRKCEYVQGYKFHKPMDILSLQVVVDNETLYQNLFNDDESLDYKEYVGFYKYGRLAYITIDESGQINLKSDLLEKTLQYEIRDGEQIQALVINSLSQQFEHHLGDVLKTGAQRSFMTEFVGLKESVPVKVTLMKNTDTLADVFLEDLRDRREVYERTKNIYNRYDLIFDKVNTAIIVSDKNLVVQEWNRQAEVIFGYSKQEAMGKSLIKLIVEDRHRDSMDSIVSKTFTGEDTESINENIRKDGSTITCRWKNNTLTNETGEVIGIISWAMDITEKKRVEEELNLLSTVFKQEPAPIVITDIDGKIEYVNQAFTTVTGYTADEALGKNPRILASGLQTKEFYEELWDTILSGHVWEGEFKNIKKNGEIYITASRIFPIKNENGLIRRFSCIQKDITEDIEKDNKIKEINNTLETQERLSMIGQMAAGIMHEINNPLSFIDINVHTLPKMLEDIEQNDQNREIILELFDLSKDLAMGMDSIKDIAAGLKRFTYRSMSNEFYEVNLNDEIQTVAVISKNEYKYYSEMDIEVGDIPLVLGDAGKIKQVLLNLVINAVHAIKDRDDGVHGQIHIRTYEEDDYVCCDVSDNGTGIPPEIQDRIFENLFTTKKEGQGTGLGLNLSKRIIEEEHKGTLTFTSELGVGTTFTVRLQKYENQ